MFHTDAIRLAEEQRKQGGIKLDKLAIGTKLEIQTANSIYKIEKLSDTQYKVEGGTRFLKPSTTWIAGSTWGGSMLMQDWIGLDMRVEMGHPDPNKRTLTTSVVKSIKIIAADNSYSYEITHPVS